MNIPDRDLPLAKMIRECQEENHRTYGYRRVNIGVKRQVGLKRQGIYHNPKTVLRVMQKVQLVVCCTQKEISLLQVSTYTDKNLMPKDQAKNG